MLTTTLTADERRALALLSSSCQSRATQKLLAAHGFDAPPVAERVNEGLATLTREQVNAGAELVEVGRVRIREARRDARECGLHQANRITLTAACRFNNLLGDDFATI